MELIEPIGRIPDIDEFPLMSEIAKKLRDAYLSVDFHEIISLMADDVVYLSHCNHTEIKGLEKVACHFMKKAQDILRENDNITAFVGKLLLERNQCDIKSNGRLIRIKFHHGEPVVHLSNSIDIVLRFSLNPMGQIQTITLIPRGRAFSILLDYKSYLAGCDLEEKGIMALADSLAERGFKIEAIYLYDIPNIAASKDDQLYFMMVQSVKVPFKAEFSEDRKERFIEHCKSFDAVALFGKAVFKMDNDRPYDIRETEELRCEYEVSELQDSPLSS